MKKPVFDSFDRLVMETNTFIGKSLRRKLRALRIKRKIFKI